MVEFKSYLPGTPSWVDLSSPDLAGAKAFYGALFGWEATEGSPEGGGYCMFRKRRQERRRSGTGHGRTANAGVDDLRVGAQTSTPPSPRSAPRVGRSSWSLSMSSTWDAWPSSSIPPARPSPCGSPGAHRGADLANEPGAFTWNELQTRDTETAKSFYQAVFGWGASTRHDGPVVYTEWKRGDDSVGGMMEMPAEVPPQIPAYWLVYFAVDDCEATVATGHQAGRGRRSLRPHGRGSGPFRRPQ